MRVSALMAGAALLLTGCAAPMEGPRLAELYDQTESLYVAEAKFRKDYAPADAPVDAETVARNFLTIAFETESQLAGEETVVSGEEIRLLRWPGDITFSTRGATPEDQQYLGALISRISPLINRQIVPVPVATDAQIRILVVRSSERYAILEALQEVGRGPIAGFVQAWVERPSFPCIGSIVNDQTENGGIRFGLILIKAELQHDFRRACLTEEFVQTLGLLNDSPEVRPSIFNDDQEFIELTRHDEYLLRILYDPRLRIGMTRDEAEPTVRMIAQELLADQRQVGQIR